NATHQSAARRRTLSTSGPIRMRKTTTATTLDVLELATSVALMPRSGLMVLVSSDEYAYQPKKAMQKPIQERWNERICGAAKENILMLFALPYASYVSWFSVKIPIVAVLRTDLYLLGQPAIAEIYTRVNNRVDKIWEALHFFHN
ncbi:hypothetical protein HDU83_003116, partial [Entophlyctis luteolus]